MRINGPMPPGRRILAVGAILLLGGASLSAQIVIVDNSDPEFTILEGDWGSGSFGTPHGTDYNYAFTTDGAAPAEAEWRPDLPVSGQYQVAIWYVQGRNRSVNSDFTVHHAGGSTTVPVNQQANGESWFILGVFNFNAGTGGYVTLSNDANPSVVIADAVRFAGPASTVELTLAVSPPDTGSTLPAVGGPYVRVVNDVVPIAALGDPGYRFDHWEVSAGVPVPDAVATSTVLMDQSKTVTAAFVADTGETDPPEFRAFWADAFNPGFKSTADIDAMIMLARIGNYNAVIPEVLVYRDTAESGHGAYWNSSIVPKAGDIIGDIDPLAYLVQQAHANGIEVHPWVVPYLACSVWPPSGNAVIQPEWVTVSEGDIGGGPAPIDGIYTLDPGSPDVQEYEISILREVVTNYEIDGFHWDFIRYRSTNAGYPADTSYIASGLARFQAIAGYVGTPPYSGNALWDEFRRREINELVRRARAEIASISSNPRQPLRYTAALITWGDAPGDFTSSNAYSLFQDWRAWMELGYLDAGIPMCYYREHNPPHDQWYRNWVDAAIGWKYDRHMYPGPGIYLNTFANSQTQMLYARNAGADGMCTYSYYGTNDDGQPRTNWYGQVASGVYVNPAPVPGMSWRDPNTATEGTLWGRVTDVFTGAALDDTTVTIAGVGAVQCDGNGYYVVTMVPPSPPNHAVTASQAGYVDRTVAATISAGDIGRLDITLGECGDDDDCSDGVWCNGLETCAGGECLEGTAPCGPGEWCDEAGQACILYGDGDFDADGDIDLTDSAAFQSCFGETAGVECEPGNLTGDDGLIDWPDFETLATLFAGPV